MKTIITTIAILLIIVNFVCAESLWKSDSKGMFSDLKAKQIGDVVTILIDEATSSSNKANTNFDKTLKHANKPGIGTLLSLLPELSISAGQSGKASGSTDRTSKFVARITAKVTKVEPNGNLELEGTRTIQTNSEKQEIKLTGTVRQEDISPDNTVLSTYLADAKISSSGKGPIGDRQNEGIISKLIKWLF